MNRIRPLSIAVALSGTFALWGCGGGGGAGTSSAPGATGPSAAQLSGAVQGLGSVVVNGVRMSTLGATLSDEDGHVFQKAKLGIGQQVSVSGTVSADDLTGEATEIKLIREFSGPVQAVTSNNFSLLGQTFSVNASTLFKSESSAVAGSFSQISVGDYVEVYAVRQSDGQYLATYVEEQTGKASLESGIEGRGIVSDLNTTAKTFTMGELTINYATANVSGTLANGATVRFKATLDPVYGMNGSASLTVTSVEVKSAQSRFGGANRKIEVSGYVESDANDQNPATFTLAGLVVDVSAARFEGLSSVSVGDLVEVKGVLDGGVLKASKVETESARESSRGGRYEFYGVASNGVYNSAANRLAFTIQGQAVEFARAINQGSTDVCGISTTGSTPYVEVKGQLTNGIIQASKVECQSGNDDDNDDDGRDDSAFSGKQFEMKGVVSNYNSAAREFTLNGTRVSVQNTRFKDGNVSQLGNGDRVEVKGALDANQVFQATELEFED